MTQAQNLLIHITEKILLVYSSGTNYLYSYLSNSFNTVALGRVRTLRNMCIAYTSLQSLALRYLSLSPVSSNFWFMRVLTWFSFRFASGFKLKKYQKEVLGVMTAAASLLHIRNEWVNFEIHANYTTNF